MSKGFAGVNVCNIHFDELDFDTEKSVSNSDTRGCICIKIHHDIVTPPLSQPELDRQFLPRDISETPTPLACVLALASSRPRQHLAMSLFHIFEALWSPADSICAHL